MQTSRFQLGLIATLALGLGFSLSSSDAIGYPAGAAVSMGNNPVFSSGGNVNGTGNRTLSSLVSGDYAIVITDVVLAPSDGYNNCFGNTRVTIENGSTTLASFGVGVSSAPDQTQYDPRFVGTLRSGIRLDPGVAPIISMQSLSEGNCEDGSMGVEYTVSGYYAHP